MAYTKKTSGLTMYIAGTGTILALLAFLVGLSSYGIHLTTSGDQVCAGTSQEPCVSYFNVTSDTYNLVFKTAIVYFDSTTGMTFQVYKRGLSGTKFSFDKTGQKWNKFSLTSGKIGNVTTTVGGVNQFMLVGYKTDITKNVKWGVKLPGVLGTTLVDADPVWAGYAPADFFVTMKSSKADLTFGEATFTVKNPTTFDVPLNSQKFSALIASAEGSSQITGVSTSYARKISTSTQAWVPNVQCTTSTKILSTNANGTQVTAQTQTCTDLGAYETQPLISVASGPLDSKGITLAPGESVDVTLRVSWKPQTGDNAHAWDARWNVSGTVLGAGW